MSGNFTLFEGILIMGAKILIPIIPAYVFFRFLPSDASVNGYFAGKKIKLGGAFAGYFLIFIILLQFPVPKYSYWSITGTIGSDEEYFDCSGLLLVVKPPPRGTDPYGKFGKFTFREVPISNSTRGPWPTIGFLRDGYYQEWIELDKDTMLLRQINLEIDRNNKKIVIKTPTFLKKRERRQTVESERIMRNLQMPIRQREMENEDSNN